MNIVLTERPDRVPLSKACTVLGLNRSSVYARKRRPAQTTPNRSRKLSKQPRALTSAEKQQVVDTLHSEVFCNQPPAAVYQSLLQQGKYLCSISSMHRILRAQNQSGERRNQRSAQHHAIPRLLAYKPNDVWSWDITKLPLQRRGVYLSLYVVIDLFSRFVVAWMLSRKENSALATQLMNEAVTRYRIKPGQLTIHQDRGSPMIAHGYLDQMKELDITCSHSRPRVSNDNPFSESQFKTAKYQPDYPGKFSHIAHARAWCEDYFEWYNFKHHHSGLAGYTPEQVFTDRYKDIALQKQSALDSAYQTHPERFVSGRPEVAMPPTFVAINPVPNDQKDETDGRVNFPTLRAAGYQK